MSPIIPSTPPQPQPEGRVRLGELGLSTKFFDSRPQLQPFLSSLLQHAEAKLSAKQHIAESFNVSKIFFYLFPLSDDDFNIYHISGSRGPFI